MVELLVGCGIIIPAIALIVVSIVSISEILDGNPRWYCWLGAAPVVLLFVAVILIAAFNVGQEILSL